MINDPTSEVNALNECGVVTVFNSYGSGFRTWGNRSAAYPTSTNPTNFINVRRTADILHESVEYSMLQFMDYPIDNGLIDSICETVNQFIRTLIGRGALIDGKCSFNADKNPATEIANGIEQLSPVKRAYVRRFWFPARYVVMVEEVTPALTISPSEEAPAVAALAITGELIGREYLPLSDKFKAVKVLTYGTNNDDYEKWDVEKINNLYKLGKLLEEYSGERVLYIDLRIKHNAFVQLESVKIKLGEIDISVFERIKAIHDILPQIKQMSEKIQYIDLSWKDSKYLKME